MEKRRIDVLIAEDSTVMRNLLVHLLESDPQIHVVGSVANGREALEFIARSHADVIVMDIVMPVMDGFDATRRIMETRPLPIVMCSACVDPYETATLFRSMEAGAVACVEKPVAPGAKGFESKVANLLQTVKLMSEVRVVRRWARQAPREVEALRHRLPTGRRNYIDIIGIGASTGGPPVLQTIFAALPKDFLAPLLVVQHIAPGFLPGMVEWLNQTTAMKVQIAAYGLRPMPGHVYLAPDDFHMSVQTGGEIVLSKEEPEHGVRPAVSRLFHSLADVYGARAVGVLLTGMGKDGAEGLKRMKDRGAATIAQDRESSVVHGMPGEAVALGAATYVLAAEKIASTLVTLANRATLSEGEAS